MKDGIHPEYIDSVITCVCGSELKTRSTVGDLHVGICSQCHPFYTGKQTQTGAAGRAEKFKQKYAKTAKSAPSPKAPAKPAAAS
ncbi:MAG: 50S ribosomal protein L31 [Nitrospinota bacterium]